MRTSTGLVDSSSSFRMIFHDDGNYFLQNWPTAGVTAKHYFPHISMKNCHLSFGNTKLQIVALHNGF